MEKTANLSRVLMCVYDKHLLFFAVIPLFLLHQSLRNESSFCYPSELFEASLLLFDQKEAK